MNSMIQKQAPDGWRAGGLFSHNRNFNRPKPAMWKQLGEHEQKYVVPTELVFRVLDATQNYFLLVF
jgi:hypothetical protein